MFEISEKHIFEYMRCPLYYDLVNNKHIEVEKRFSVATHLGRVGNSFLINLMNGKVLTQTELKKKWDAICEKEKDHITPSRCMEGVSQLMKLYLWAENQELRIADVKTPYAVSIKSIFMPNTAIKVHGEMEAISIGKNGSVELLVLDFNNRSLDQSVLDMKIKYTLDSIAFKKLYGKDVGIHVHHVKDNKDYFAYRIKDDEERLIATINSIAYSISKKLYYPRENILCSSCELKNFCKGWRG